MKIWANKNEIFRLFEHYSAFGIHCRMRLLVIQILMLATVIIITAWEFKKAAMNYKSAEVLQIEYLAIYNHL